MTTAQARPQVGEPPRGPLSSAYRLVTLALLALVTIIAFEAMAIGTAMPVVAAELRSVRSYGLAFSLMLTAQLLAIVVAGVWTNRRGPIPPLMVGQLLLAAGSAMAGLAPTFAVLLLGRVVAGLGAGLIIVALYVVIGRAYPEQIRPQVFGWISAAWVLPSLVGPPVAGWLATSLSWRLVFLIVLPPIAVTAVVVWRRRARMRHDADSAEGRSTAGQRRAIALGVLVAFGAGALQWGADSLVPPSLLPVLAVVGGLTAVAVAFPRLVPVGTMRMARGLPSVVLTRLLLTAAFNGASVFVPLMLVVTRGQTPTFAGLMATLGSLGWALGSYLQGRPRFGGRRPDLVSLGGACITVSVLTFAATAGLGWPSWVIAVGSAFGGLGMGLAMSSISVLSLSLSPLSEHGRTSSSLQLADGLGAVLGIGAAGAVFAARHDGVHSDNPTYVVMWVALSVVAALVVLGGQRSRV